MRACVCACVHSACAHTFICLNHIYVTVPYSVSQDILLLGGYTTGDTIAVLLDIDAGTIQWMKNGEEYGNVEQLNGEVFFPSVSLDSPGESITLAYYCGPAVL